MSAKKRGLGRGLDALLTSNQQNSERQSSEQVSEEAKGELQKLPIEQWKPAVINLVKTCHRKRWKT